MAASYPLTIPGTGFRTITVRPSGSAAVSESPYTGAQQVYVHAREVWAAQIELPSFVSRAEAEAWRAGFLLALNFREGTFLMPGDPVNTTPMGTWAGSPKVLGAHAAGLKTIAMDGYGAGATVKAGDWLQTGSGSSTHLHQVTKDATADGSGLLTLEIWPRTRAALADNATFTTTDPVGLWRLAMSQAEYSQLVGKVYGGMTISCAEAL